MNNRPKLNVQITLLAAIAALTLSPLTPARAQTAEAEPGWLAAIRAGQVHRSREGAEHAMGAVPSSLASLARSPRFVVRTKRDGETAARPASLVLTDYLPPVQTQGQQGSCVAWSSGYYCYTYAVSKQRQLTADRIAANDKLQFSPAFLYHLGNGGKDGGMQITTAFQLLHDQGCASMADMPYNPADSTTPPSEAATAHAERYKARDTGLLYHFGEADPEKLKTYLAEARQPFVTAIPILKDFPQTAVPADFVYRPTEAPSKENVTGLHAVTIVGYDDARHAFRMVNSWGPQWGDGGFLWLDEDFVKSYALDGCSIVAGGIASRDPSTGAVRVGPHVSLVPPGSASGTTEPRLIPRSVR